jgi:DNA (cytosine-5)-methyltransferase 1
MDKECYGVYTQCTPKFQRGGLYELYRTLKANQHDSGVIEVNYKCKVFGMLNNGVYAKMHDMSRRVYDPDGLSPTIHTMGGGNLEPKIVAMRGRNPDSPKSRQSGLPTEQMLEVKDDGTSNTLTTVQKDNLVIEPHFRVRKLTPKECWRLMDFTDEDFDKAKEALNKTFYKGRDRSNSQMYKQAGNSIVVNVLMAIFKQMEDKP